jgi:predicted TIM-barrel fold metal-dependent hydrolase
VIIDCHCHAGQGDLLTHPANTEAPLGSYLKRALAARIDRTVVLPAFSTDYHRANAALARIVPRHRGRLIGFASVHPRRDRGRVYSMLRQAVLGWGFRGVKVHGHDALPSREVCDAARKLRVPILVDVFGEPQAAEMFASQFPDVAFIIPHFGSFADDWRVIRQVIDLITRRANVYADTSGVRQFDLIREAVERAGPEKILFGSDGPWLHPGVELHKLRLLKLARGPESLILGGNIRRLLRRQAPLAAAARPGVRLVTRQSSNDG